jgi:hypothetical protein
MVRSFQVSPVGLRAPGWKLIYFGGVCNEMLDPPQVNELFFGYAQVRGRPFVPEIVVYSAVPGGLEPPDQILVEAYVNSSRLSVFPDVPEGLTPRTVQIRDGTDAGWNLGPGKAALRGPLDIGRAPVDHGALLLTFGTREGTRVALSSWGLDSLDLLSLVRDLESLGGNSEALHWMDSQAVKLMDS